MSSMAQHHGHSHPHAAADADRRLLAIALVLLLAFTILEVVAGLVSDSLALLADAGHMATDAGALGLAVFAAWAATRPARGRWTFGFARAEILAARSTASRSCSSRPGSPSRPSAGLIDPLDVDARVVVPVALAGIALNVGVLAILSRAERQSLNVRGAYLHVATDAAAFAGTRSPGSSSS